jgi:hypothetical protein
LTIVQQIILRITGASGAPYVFSGICCILIHKEYSVRRNRICFVSCIIVIATVVSCGIPTSMPTLPKEVVVKAKPSVSLPLGQVNYNLYSGLHGGDMAGGTGGLNDLLGASWLQDFQEQGVAFYDYRPLDTEDDGIQKFLIHYRLDMADTLGGGGEFDLSKYQDILGDLTGKSIPIDPVSYTIPSMSMEQEILVKIDVEAVVSEIRNSINAIGSSRDSTAYLPVQEGLRELFFPYGILTDPQNANLNFSITLPNLEYLTLTDGTIEFEFTLKYGSFSQLLAGSSLTLSDFELRADEQSGSIEKVKPQQQSVDLLSDGAKGTLSIKFEEGAKLPQQFDLVCKLSITGKFANPAFAQGYFELTIRPDFKDYTISGVQNLELLESQIASLSSELRMDPYSISESLSPSFSATVGEGTLEIDTGELFPPLPLGGQESGAEGWNIMLDLSDLYIKQDPLSDVPGLSMGKTNGQAPLSPNNSLKDKKLNSAPVQVGGKVTASLPESKLTFCNFPGGIAKEGPVSYGKKVYVRMNVSLLSEVKVEPEDFGLGDLAKGLNPEEQELGDDFAAFTAWLNYIQFPGWTEESPDRGLGVRLEIGKLNMADGLGLFITVNGFGMDNIFQPLKNLTDPAGHPKDEARLIFLRGSKESPGAYKLMGDEIPEKLSVSVQLGLENPEDQKTYEETGILTMQNVVPGKPIEVTGAEAYLIFDWIEMSIKPRPPANEEGAENSMPDYPFAGTFPDNETGIDLSGIPQGLGFYIPPDEEAGEGLSSRLYINLKRKTLNKETGGWEEERPDDPESSGYDEHDPEGWGRNLQVNLPNLDFRVRYGDGTVSDNLFSYEPGLRVGTGSWTLSRPIGEIMEDPELGLIADDVENGDNPFKIYAGS